MEYAKQRMSMRFGNARYSAEADDMVCSYPICVPSAGDRQGVASCT
jgi:hypothetical protein